MNIRDFIKKETKRLSNIRKKASHPADLIGLDAEEAAVKYINSMIGYNECSLKDLQEHYDEVSEWEPTDINDYCYLSTYRDFIHKTIQVVNKGAK